MPDDRVRSTASVPVNLIVATVPLVTPVRLDVTTLWVVTPRVSDPEATTKPLSVP